RRACWSGYSRRQYGPQTSLLLPTRVEPAVPSIFQAGILKHKNDARPSISLGSGIVSNDPLDDRLLRTRRHSVNRSPAFVRFFVIFWSVIFALRATPNRSWKTPPEPLSAFLV